MYKIDRREGVQKSFSRKLPKSWIRGKKNDS